MTVCRNCRGSIESSFAGSVGIYWFHRGRDITGSAFCSKNPDDWHFSQTAEPFDEPVYIVSREHKITQFGLDGMWFKIREIQQDNVIWELVDIDDPERRIYVPGFWCKEPFERMEVEDDEPGIF